MNIHMAPLDAVPSTDEAEAALATLRAWAATAPWMSAGRDNPQNLMATVIGFSPYGRRLPTAQGRRLVLHPTDP